MIRVKICGLKTEKDVETAASCGADAVGFLVGQQHPSPDFILPCTAERLAAHLPVFVTPVLVTHYTDVDSILELLDLTGITVLQLHGGSTPEEVCRLKEFAGDDVKIIVAAHVYQGCGVKIPLSLYEPYVDAFLFDSFDPQNGKVGGTGLVNDWKAAARSLQETKKDVILAGGLHPGNVEEAVLKVRPCGVDANSRLKDPDGSLNEYLAREFVRKAKSIVIPAVENTLPE